MKVKHHHQQIIFAREKRGNIMAITSLWPVPPSIRKFIFMLILVCGVSETLGAATSTEKNVRKSTQQHQQTTNTSAKKTMTTAVHENLKDAGKKAGLLIWRIEVSVCCSNLIQFNGAPIYTPPRKDVCSARVTEKGASYWVVQRLCTPRVGGGAEERQHFRERLIYEWKIFVNRFALLYVLLLFFFFGL